MPLDHPLDHPLPMSSITRGNDGVSRRISRFGLGRVCVYGLQLHRMRSVGQQRYAPARAIMDHGYDAKMAAIGELIGAELE